MFDMRRTSSGLLHTKYDWSSCRSEDHRVSRRKISPRYIGMTNLRRDIYLHLEETSIPLQMISFSWFMCLFIVGLPLDAATRVLDCFFFEGREIFFKIGLALFKLKEKEILEEKDGNAIVQMMKSLEKSVDVEQLFKVRGAVSLNLDCLHGIQFNSFRIHSRTLRIVSISSDPVSEAQMIYSLGTDKCVCLSRTNR